MCLPLNRLVPVRLQRLVETSIRKAESAGGCNNSEEWERGRPDNLIRGREPARAGEKPNGACKDISASTIKYGKRFSVSQEAITLQGMVVHNRNGMSIFVLFE